MYGSGSRHGVSTHRLGTPYITPKTDPAERGGDAPWLIRELIVKPSIYHVFLGQISIPKITNKTKETRNAWQSLANSPLGAIVSPPSK